MQVVKAQMLLYCHYGQLFYVLGHDRVNIHDTRMLKLMQLHGSQPILVLLFTADLFPQSHLKTCLFKNAYYIKLAVQE